MRVLLFMLLLAAACKTVPVAGECPDNVQLPCATRRTCTEDRPRGCMRCTCESAESDMPVQKPETRPGD